MVQTATINAIVKMMNSATLWQETVRMDVKEAGLGQHASTVSDNRGRFSDFF